MAEDICRSPQITRLSLGHGRVGYQVNDFNGNYVTMETETARAAAYAIIADLYLRETLRPAPDDED